MTNRTSYLKLPILTSFVFFVCLVVAKNETKPNLSLLNWVICHLWDRCIYGKKIQNEANFLYLQAKNKVYQKNEPKSNPFLYSWVPGFLGSWVLAFLGSSTILRNEAKLRSLDYGLLSLDYLQNNAIALDKKWLNFTTQNITFAVNSPKQTR